MGEARRGRRIVLAGDTAPCDMTRLVAWEADLLVHEVVPLRSALGHAEAQHERHAGRDATLDLVRCESIAAAIVLERVAACLGLGAALVELRRRAEAPIDGARVEQSLRVGLVTREICALVCDVLVPGEAEHFGEPQAGVCAGEEQRPVAGWAGGEEAGELCPGEDALV